MTASRGQIEFVSREDKPSDKSRETDQPRSPEQREDARPVPGLDEIARKAAEQFTTPEARRLFRENLLKALAERKDQLTTEFRRSLENPDGELDPAKTVRALGLPENLLEENEASPSFRLPERPANAKGGSELFREWGLNRDMNKHQEELTRRIIEEIEKGNVPDSLRQMHHRFLKGRDGTEITFATSSGYLAVGSNQDYITVPLSGPMAKKIADHFGWALPTATMAETGDKTADIQVRIGGETNTDYDLDHMADLEYARKHNERAQQELQNQLDRYNTQARRQNRPQLTMTEFMAKNLVRGQKKNIFIGQRSDEGGIGIGGLLDPKGHPIQPYQYPHPQRGPHGETGFHGDYSQSTPIYDPMITIVEPGKAPRQMHLYDALRDERYASILNASESRRDSSGKVTHTFDADRAYTAPGEDRSQRDRQQSGPSAPGLDLI